MLKVLANFDWITPTISLIRCVRGYRPISCWWSPKTPAFYQRVLRIEGIDAKAGPVTDEGFILLVPAADVDGARHILKEVGAWLA